MNPFVSVLREARVKRWCVKPACTTCGAAQFRSALETLAGPFGGPLVDALSDLTPLDITVFADWPDAIELTFRNLPVGRELVLDKWLEHVGGDLRFDDVILFRIIRHFGPGSNTRKRWLSALVPIAVQARDFSLVESLLLIMRHESVAYPELIAVADSLCAQSPQMRRVMRNAGLNNPP